MCAVKAFPGPHDYQLGTAELLGWGAEGAEDGGRMGDGGRGGGVGGRDSVLQTHPLLHVWWGMGSRTHTLQTK